MTLATVKELDLDGLDLPIGRIIGKAYWREGEWRALVSGHGGPLLLVSLKITAQVPNVIADASQMG